MINIRLEFRTVTNRPASLGDAGDNQPESIQHDHQGESIEENTKSERPGAGKQGGR